jgi:hypothetical protein
MRRFVVLPIFLSIASLLIVDADAAGKKQKSRTDYTKEQQQKFYDEALKLCRKKYRTSLHFVKVDYKKNQYVCYHYG